MSLRCDAGCDGRLDVVLVVESSHNIRRERYPHVLGLLSSVVEQFQVSTDQTRVGAVIYSQSAIVQFNLSAHDNKHDVITAVRRMPYLGGRTRVANALQVMVRVYSDEKSSSSSSSGASPGQKFIRWTRMASMQSASL